MIDGQPERAIVNPITGVDSKIDDFCTAFANLREDFRTKNSVHITLVQLQMASAVDLMRGYL